MENSAGISFMGFTRMDLESAVCFLCAVAFFTFSDGLFLAGSS